MHLLFSLQAKRSSFRLSDAEKLSRQKTLSINFPIDEKINRREIYHQKSIVLETSLKNTNHGKSNSINIY